MSEIVRSSGYKVPRIRIYDEGLTTGRVKIYIDDKEIHGVVGYEIEHSAEHFARLTLHIRGDGDYKVKGRVEEITATPTTIEDSLNEAESILKQAARENMIDIRYVARLLSRVLPLLPKEECTGNPAD